MDDGKVFRSSAHGASWFLMNFNQYDFIVAYVLIATPFIIVWSALNVQYAIKLTKLRIYWLLIFSLGFRWKCEKKNCAATVIHDPSFISITRASDGVQKIKIKVNTNEIQKAESFFVAAWEKPKAWDLRQLRRQFQFKCMHFGHWSK